MITQVKNCECSHVASLRIVRSRRAAFLWKISLLLLLMTAAPIPAEALITVGAMEFPGIARDVEIADQFAYVAAQSAGLRIIDISNPSAPLEVAIVDTPGTAVGVEVVGGFAYVADGSAGGLRVIDVSDPSSPKEMGIFDTLTDARDVAVTNGIAYLIDGKHLRIIDVSNPVLLEELSAFDFGSSAYLKDIKVVDEVAYVIDGRSGVRILDVSDSARPIELAVLSMSSFGDEIEVVGGVGYLPDRVVGSSGRPNALRIIDVTNPAAPVQLSALATFTDIRAVEIHGQFAYVTDAPSSLSPGTLRILDVSDPTNPSELSGLSIPNYGDDVAVSARYAFIVGRLIREADVSSIRVVDLSNPTLPAELGSLAFSYGPRAIEVSDGLAFLVKGSRERGDVFWTIDVSDASAPRALGSFQTHQEVTDIEIVDHVAYLTEAEILRGSGSFEIVDVSDPTMPVRLAKLGISDHPQDVEVVEGIAYVVGRPQDLHERYGFLTIVDVSNPSAPVRLSTLELPTWSFAVRVVDALAHITQSSSGIGIIDVSNPESPVELGVLDTGRSFGLGVSDHLAYVLDDLSHRFQIVDASTPKIPLLLSELQHYTRGFGHIQKEIRTDGSLALHGISNTVRILDISDPLAPFDLGGLAIAGEIALANGLAYVSDLGFGLRIIDLGPEYESKRSVEIDIKPGSTPNSINPTNMGNVPVAILSSEMFDVFEIDTASLVFANGEAAPAHDLADPMNFTNHLEDVDGDGLADLVVHFSTEETGIAFGEMMACLGGEALDGVRIRGCDSVRTVPDMDGDALLDVEEATIGTNALNPDTDGDGFDDGQEVLLMGTDPLDPLDPTPDPVPEPASWLMLVAGTAFLGLLYRRRAR